MYTVQYLSYVFPLFDNSFACNGTRLRSQKTPTCRTYIHIERLKPHQTRYRTIYSSSSVTLTRTTTTTAKSTTTGASKHLQ